MGRLENVRLSRRDMLRLSAGGAGMMALTASGFAVPRGFGSGGGGGGSLYLEAFPTSPLVLKPFSDELVVPMAEPAVNMKDTSSASFKEMKALGGGKLPDPACQDSFGPDSVKNATYNNMYGIEMGKHQLWPGQGRTSGYFGSDTDPRMNCYCIDLKVAGHKFTTSAVQPIDSFGRNIVPPGMNSSSPRYLPESTIYGFNGKFPGPRINAEYGTASLVRFHNSLDQSNGYDRQDFGAPNYSFLTHLHNGHTAPESDGQPHYAYHRFSPMNRFTHEAAWEPGEWVDQMYLGYPAGGDDREKQSFFWFHDHVHGFTGANVYKGMVGLMPQYDPILDNGDETKSDGLHLPGRRTNNPDGTFDVAYDIPLALYDCRLDDGVTLHHDAHDVDASGAPLAAKTHPEWWGKTFFKHFPNHGFVGDIFTVNGTAYPVMHVKRRRYRLRFLDASISRIYHLQLMHSTKGPKAAKDLGYTGDELQGQYRLPDGQQCMKLYQVAGEGGLLPKVVERDGFELWPAKRREFVVDFTRYQDGSETKVGDEIYLVNTMKMTTGRLWDAPDPAYKVPIMKIVITDEAPKDEPDMSFDPRTLPNLRAVQPIPQGWETKINDQSIPSFTLMRGSSNADPETEWLINGQQFEPTKPLISVKMDSSAYWRIKNGGGGWVHPMHLHMEEHRVISRNGVKWTDYVNTPGGRRPDDAVQEDVVALDPSEDVVIHRKFRTFCGPYVAHCHNLAHEDHNMMFGWEIKP